ncbi:MAG: hypothetical protein MAG715_01243 [Methanonatronarchaeales archaeon]|nr:hypothetical protein [Methanonatronarchaeales archaeon]
MVEFSIEELPETEFSKLSNDLHQLASRVLPKYSSKYSRKDYTLRQHAVCICLKIKEDAGYEEIVEKLVEWIRVRKNIGLNRVPDPSTLCRVFNKIATQVWRAILAMTLKKLDTSGTVAIDSTGFDRSHASRHYTQRTGLKISSLKNTLLVDPETLAILDIYLTTTRKHDTKIAPSLIKRNLELIEQLLGDKGFDDQDLRDLCLNNDIDPVILYREFTEKQEKLNEQINEEEYNQRNMNETVNFCLKNNYGAGVYSHKWFNQYKEQIIKCTLHNLETASLRTLLNLLYHATKPYKQRVAI